MRLLTSTFARIIPFFLIICGEILFSACNKSEPRHMLVLIGDGVAPICIVDHHLFGLVLSLFHGQLDIIHGIILII